ncbi:MAG: AAA family ATPase [Actinobacteria bacterium]|nr:AAA family ATPase [Actinomycetota bacterium]
MTPAVRLYFTGTCDGFETLRAALAEHADVDVVGWSAHVAQATGPLAGGHLECVIHATGANDFPAAEVAAIREHTRAPVILVASGSEAAAMLEAALATDVADVLLLPQLTHNVLFAIRKAAHARRQLETAAHRGRVVTVFSPKGGTGKTVVSTNIAASLAKRDGRRTLLLDLDLQFGDSAIVLGIEPEKTIFDLVVGPGELDAEKVAGYVSRHPCGLDVLPAPLRPEDAELVTEAKIIALLEVVRGSYDAIVVDTSPFFHGPMLATLDRTDELLVLCGLDIPTLKNVRLALQTLELLSFPTSRIRYVMNRVNSNLGLKTREVEEGLRVKVACELPMDRRVQVCVNRGEPIVLAEPRADFSGAIASLARMVVPAAPTTSKQAHHRRLSFAKA